MHIAIFLAKHKIALRRIENWLDPFIESGAEHSSLFFKDSGGSLGKVQGRQQNVVA